MAKRETISMEIPEPFDLRSEDIVEDQHSKLKSLFPEVFTEGGKLDFDKLKLTLGEMIDVGKERYGMMWPGKADCFKTIQSPSVATLLPDRKESLDFDSTENLIIEGDNLEVLKLLQKGYIGQIQMIYIDPPFNTGKDFIYPDKFGETLQTYLRYTGQLDSAGQSFSTNSEVDGRYHSKWLNMMYPRLFLARNLLRADGVIFISIDDNEVDNLRKLCNEIFGEENFVANIVWQKKYAPQNDETYFSESHEHLLLFAKSKDLYVTGLLPRTEEANQRYRNPDKDPRGDWKPSDLTRQEYRERDDYEIVSPITGKRFPPPKGNSWGRPQEVIKALIADNRISFGSDGNSVPQLKRFLSEVKQGITPQTIWYREDVGDTQEAKREIKGFFGDVSVFDTPKPTRLIARQIMTANCPLHESAFVLDFFAGSGTVGQAVMEANAQDGGNRHFILVQLPEPTEREDFKTISDITKERMRRVAKKLSGSDESKLDLNGKLKQDRGFKVLKLNTSNFTTWNSSVPDDEQKLAEQMQLHIDHILPGRSQEDILYELLLKSGFPLTTKIETRKMAGKNVFFIADGAMLICLENKLTQEVIKAIADEKPQRVICLDAGFENNDQLKANAVQTMKARGVEKFQTV